MVEELMTKLQWEWLRFDTAQTDVIQRWPRLYPPDYYAWGDFGQGPRPLFVEVKYRATPFVKARERFGLKPEACVSLEIVKLAAYMLWERIEKATCLVFVVKDFPGQAHPEVRWNLAWWLSYLHIAYPERILHLRERQRMPTQIKEVVFLDFYHDLRPIARLRPLEGTHGKKSIHS